MEPKEELFVDIYKKKNQILDLQDKEELYKKLSKSIEQLISYLKSAENCANDSYLGLNEYYQDSINASEKVTELETQYTNIQEIVNKLNYNILVECNDQIDSIKRGIENQKDRLERLINRYNSMET